jgi:hypothetical protein
MGGSSATRGLFYFLPRKGQDINPWPFLLQEVKDDSAGNGGVSEVRCFKGDWGALRLF